MYLLSLFSDNTENYFSQMMTLDLDKLANAADAIESPLLRASLLNAAEREEGVASVVETFAADEEISLAGLLFCAAYYGNEEQPEKALELLLRAQFLPMKKAMRIKIDSSLAAWSVDMVEDKSESANHEKLLAAGQAAALRLRRSVGSLEQREELGEMLEKLGLEDEAEKLLKAAAAIQSPSPVFPTTRQPQTLPEKLGKLLEDGKRPRALRLLANELRNQVNAILRPAPGSSMYGNRGSNWAALRSFIISKKLDADLLAGVTPDADSDSARQWADFAAAHEALGMKEEANKLYTRALELDPDNLPVLTRYIPELALSDPDLALKNLQKLRPQNLDITGALLLEQCLKNTEESDAKADAARLTKIAKLTAKYLEGLDHRKKLRPSIDWMNPIADLVSGEDVDLDYDLRRFIGSNASNEIQSIEAPKSTPELIAARDALLEAMLSTPALSAAAFERHLDLAEIDKDLQKLTSQRAQKSLLIGGAGSSVTAISYYGYSEENAIPTRAPEFILAREAWLAKDRATIEQLLIPELKAEKKKDAAENIEFLAALFFDDADSFLETAESFNRKRPGGFSNNDVNVSSTILEIWKERKLDLDLGSFLIETIKGKRNQNVTGYDSFATFAEHLSRESGYDTAQKFLEEFTEAALGNENQRKSLARELKKGNYSPSATSFLLYAQTWETLASSPALSFNAFELKTNYLEALAEASKQQYGSNISGSYYFFSTASKEDPSAQWEDLVNGSPFFRPIETFDLMQLPGTERKSAFGTLADKLDNLYGPTEETIRKSLDAKPESFGRDLLLASLDGTGPVYEALAKQRTALDALPPEKLKALAAISFQLQPDLFKISDEARAVYELFLDIRKDNAREVLEQFLTMETHPEPEKIRGEMIEILRPLVAIDRDKAHEVYKKAIELVEKHNSTSRKEIKTSSWARQIIDTIDTVEALAFSLELATEPSESPLARPDLDNLLRSRYNGSHSILDAVMKDDVDTTAEVIETIIPHVRRPESIQLLFTIIYEKVRGDSAAVKAVMTFLDGQTEASDVTAGFKSMFSFTTDEPDTDFYLGFLQKKNVSLPAKLKLYEMIYRRDYKKPPTEKLTRSAADCLADAWEQDISIPPFTSVVLIQEFEKIPEHDEAWKTSAMRLTKSWKPLKTERLSSSFMLSIALEIGDQATVEKIANASKSDGIEAEPSSVLVLIQHRQLDLARQVLIKHWKKFDFSDADEGFTYSDDFPAAAAELVSSIEQADVRYFTELLCATAHDQRVTDEAEAYEQRAARVAEVAKRFSTNGVNFVPTKRRFLGLISDYPSAAATIPEAYASEAKNITLTEIVNSRRSTNRLSDEWLKRTIYFTNISLRVASEGAPAIGHFLGLNFPDAKLQEDKYQTVVGTVLTAIATGINEGWSELDPENLAASTKLCREFIAAQPADVTLYMHDSRHYYDPFDKSAFLYTIHALADDLDALHAWRKKESSSLAKPTTELIDPLMDNLAEALDRPQVPDDRRLEVLLRSLGDPIIVGLCKSHQQAAEDLSAALVDGRFFSEEVLLENGLAIAKANPCQGMLAEFLAEHFREQKQYDKALEAHDHAIAALPKRSMLYYTEFHLAKAETLLAAGKNTEALALLDDFNTLRIPLGDKSRWLKKFKDLKLKASGEEPQEVPKK